MELVVARLIQALALTAGWVLIGVGFDWPWQAYLGGGIICGVLPGMFR